MEFTQCSIPEVVLIRPRVYEDHRGFFLETWQRKLFEEAGIATGFVQDNLSRSRQWTLRGLHYQVDQPQGKLVSVVRGVAFDVAVDLRRSSPTFGMWVGAELSDINHQMLWIPPGFAHGFLALSETVDFAYKCTEYYAPRCERSVRWDDERIDIRWPLPSGVRPLLTDKDRDAPSISVAETYP